MSGQFFSYRGKSEIEHTGDGGRSSVGVRIKFNHSARRLVHRVVEFNFHKTPELGEEGERIYGNFYGRFFHHETTAVVDKSSQTVAGSHKVETLFACIKPEFIGFIVGETRESSYDLPCRQQAIGSVDNYYIEGGSSRISRIMFILRYEHNDVIVGIKPDAFRLLKRMGIAIIHSRLHIAERSQRIVIQGERKSRKNAEG